MGTGSDRAHHGIGMDVTGQGKGSDPFLLLSPRASGATRRLGSGEGSSLQLTILRRTKAYHLSLL